MQRGPQKRSPHPCRPRDTDGAVLCIPPAVRACTPVFWDPLSVPPAFSLLLCSLLFTPPTPTPVEAELKVGRKGWEKRWGRKLPFGS